jgi:hypothetical protein
VTAEAKGGVLIHSVNGVAQAEQWEHRALQVPGWVVSIHSSKFIVWARCFTRQPWSKHRLKPRLGWFGQCLATSRRWSGREQAGNTGNRSLLQHNAQYDRHRNSQRCRRPRPRRSQHSYVHRPGTPRPSTHATMRTRRLYSSNDKRAR